MTDKALNTHIKYDWCKIPRSEWRAIISKLQVGQVLESYPYQFPNKPYSRIPVAGRIFVFERSIIDDRNGIQYLYKVVDIYKDGEKPNIKELQ